MYPRQITRLGFQGLFEYDPPIGLVTGQIPSSLSTNITSICAITVSPMHATCPTKFIRDFISCGEERRLQTSLLLLTMQLLITSSATGSNVPQTALHFICKRQVGEKGLLYQGKELLNSDPEHKKQ
jgi:hypothetical protein